MPIHSDTPPPEAPTFEPYDPFHSPFAQQGATAESNTVSEAVPEFVLTKETSIGEWAAASHP